MIRALVRLRQKDVQQTFRAKFLFWQKFKWWWLKALSLFFYAAEFLFKVLLFDGAHKLFGSYVIKKEKLYWDNYPEMHVLEWSRKSVENMSKHESYIPISLK